MNLKTTLFALIDKSNKNIYISIHKSNPIPKDVSGIIRNTKVKTIYEKNPENFIYEILIHWHGKDIFEKIFPMVSNLGFSMGDNTLLVFPSKKNQIQGILNKWWFNKNYRSFLFTCLKTNKLNRKNFIFDIEKYHQQGYNVLTYEFVKDIKRFFPRDEKQLFSRQQFKNRTIKPESFVYLWKDLKTRKIYLGFHVGKLNDGYICSSQYVKNQIKSRPQDFKRFIIAKGSRERMLALETDLLKYFAAGNSPYFFNRQNTSILKERFIPITTEFYEKKNIVEEYIVNNFKS